MADDNSGLLGDEDDEQLNASNGKAKITRKRYTREMIVTLLEIVDEVLPYGNRDWETVAAKYNHIFNVRHLAAAASAATAATAAPR
jgi:hypothetical protein